MNDEAQTKLGKRTWVPLGIVVVLLVFSIKASSDARGAFDRLTASNDTLTSAVDNLRTEMRAEIRKTLTIEDFKTYTAKLARNNANLKLDVPDIEEIIASRLQLQRGN